VSFALTPEPAASSDALVMRWPDASPDSEVSSMLCWSDKLRCAVIEPTFARINITQSTP
jgi:hypothetical protein